MANDYLGMSFSGRLGRDAEMKYSKKGNAVVKLGVAVSQGKWNSVANEFEPATMWVNVTMFGKGAEALMPKLNKGSAVIVDVDRLEFDTETGGPTVFARRSGEAGSSFSVIAKKIFVTDAKGFNPQESVPASTPGSDDDIPF